MTRPIGLRPRNHRMLLHTSYDLRYRYEPKADKIGSSYCRWTTLQGNCKSTRRIQRTRKSFTEEVVHHLPKPKAHEGDVPFLMNCVTQTTGTFKFGSTDANNTTVWQLCNQAFKGSLEVLMVTNFIHYITRPWFGNTIKICYDFTGKCQYWYSELTE